MPSPSSPRPVTEPPPAQTPSAAWRHDTDGAPPSLPEVHNTIAVHSCAGFWRKFLAFSGPGYLIAVGYMDPGNWATDIAGGAQFGYTLLSVILVANLMAVLLQALSAKLGIVTGRDLAHACRDHYSPPVNYSLWVLCEIAIMACDLAEVIGSAIALNLLFGLPLVWGVIITAGDVLLILFLQHRGFRYIEALVIAMISVVAVSFLVEIVFSQPPAGAVLAGFIPSAEILRNHEMLYVAIGILGATVMPHNLYLHSSIVQTRRYTRDEAGRAEAIRFATLDSTVALTLALFVNAAILIVAAAVFHAHGRSDVGEISDAYQLLAPMLGAPIASFLFAIALLAAGQIVMEGFLNLRIRPWLRRLITRVLAVIPAAIIAGLYGERGVNNLLILSQVVLSLQLAFAVVPLVLFTSDRAKMGRFANARWLKTLAWITTAVIIILNAKLVGDYFHLTDWLR